MGRKRKAATDDDDGAGGTAPGAVLSNGGAAEEKEEDFVNKEKVLVLSSRGITFRYRHLMTDILALLPHSKKDVKLDTKDDRQVLNEIADLKSCSSCLFFEARKHKDLYMWLSKTPNGPCVKFLVNNIHTMAELKLTGNHLKGSRPVLSFEPVFDTQPHLRVLKEMLIQVFDTPRDHRKSKPFFDHILTFTLVDNRIWFRNYQVAQPQHKGKLDKSALEKMTLVEVGPRFCLNPIKVFAGSFGGPTLYENPNYVSPNLTRAMEKRANASKYTKRVKAKQRRKQHEVVNRLKPTELDTVFRT
eukprot:jgi/Chlat1/6543/Chrsp45S06017